MPSASQTACHDFRCVALVRAVQGIRPGADARQLRRRVPPRRRGRRFRHGRADAGVTGARGDRAYPEADARSVHRHEALPRARRRGVRRGGEQRDHQRNQGRVGRRLPRPPQGRPGPSRPPLLRPGDAVPRLAPGHAVASRIAAVTRRRCEDLRRRRAERADRACRSLPALGSRRRTRSARSRPPISGIISRALPSKRSTGPATTRSLSSSGGAAICWASTVSTSRTARSYRCVETSTRWDCWQNAINRCSPCVPHFCRMPVVRVRLGRADTCLYAAAPVPPRACAQGGTEAEAYPRPFW